VGRNPPKNLSKSTSLKDYLKKSDPVKLARARERVRQEREIAKSLERFKLMAEPEVPTAQEEVQEIVQDIFDQTGQLPSEAEVDNIKIEVLQDRRKRGVQAGAKRGPYQTKLKTAQSVRDRELKLKGLTALENLVRARKLRRLQQAQPQSYSSEQARQDAEDEAWLQEQEALSRARRSGVAGVSFANPSPPPTAVVNSFTGQVGVAPGWD
jgi:hypothetical protein